METTKVPFLPPRSFAEVLNAERRYGVQFPDAMRDLYTVTDGTEVPGTSGVDVEGFSL